MIKKGKLIILLKTGALEDLDPISESDIEEDNIMLSVAHPNGYKYRYPLEDIQKYELWEMD